LLLDECGWEKAGHKSVGVARQYIGQVGKVSNGQVGVFAVLSRGIHAGLVGGQLYLPTAWSTDAARCTQARIPAATQAYRTKSELAAALVKYLMGSGLVRTDWVGGDAAYGNSPALRQVLENRRQAYVLDVRPGLGLHVADPTPAGPPPRPAPRPAPGGAVPRVGFSPGTQPSPCLPWPPRCRPVPGGATRTERGAKALCSAKRYACRSGAGSRSRSKRRPWSC
jgi:SRSO17 transposase